ncbi:MAG: GNAT family N-acetyltransferase [Schleiferilactobacillus harbinensis]|jgi:RimJ/RimL family protein N-acetyltransferase|nr:GNAT family N-acetyltransferase [Schleiferilactobacillus harbinensis]MCI1913454.1 GNAT family N-acetyltransferase [Schleiferilactobacillus harbinensis]
MLTTPRLTIRPFRHGPQDLSALFAILSDQTANHYLPWWPVVSLTETEKFFQTRIAPPAESEWLAVCFKTDNRPIGYITLSNGTARDLGYGLLPDYWGRGIITEAAKAVVASPAVQKLAFITATHDVQNLGSGRVMQKLGMHYQYSYDEKWQPKNRLTTFRLYQLNLADKNAPVYREYWEKYPTHFVESI